MKAIFASKMFQNSPRQDKIKAALSNPINVELTKQLQEYLDEEYIPAEPIHNTEPESVSQDTEKSPDVNESANHPAVTAPHEPLAEKHKDELSEAPAAPADSALTQETELTEQEEPAESATASYKQTITAGTTFSIATAVNDIKSLLNIRADVGGVERVNWKGDEVWIYYSDSINLNNIMSKVIELLNAGGFAYLEFNRLARSDNAIVFTFDASSTSAEVDTIKEDE